MKIVALFIALFAIVAGTVLANNNIAGTPIKDHYIIRLKDDADYTSFSHWFYTKLDTHNTIHTALHSTVHNEFQFGRFKGFSGKFDHSFISQLESHGDVKYIEQDTIVTVQKEQSHPPSWGLPRISEHRLNLAASYIYPSDAGADAEAWVIDTGILTTHQEFGGRAKMAANFVVGEPSTDLNGHGTHVSGTIGGKTYGVAKKVKLYGVKVLGASGSGSTSGVIAGVQYVIQHAKKRKAVANMSVGGGKSNALDDAVNAAVRAGIPFFVAAGNSHLNACDYSPSGASLAFTVGATDRTDTIASYSNFGTCLKIFAPGSDITSAWIGSNTAKNTISGTSMATPHTTGVGALIMSSGFAKTPSAIYKEIIKIANSNYVKGNLYSSPNRLLYNGQTKF